MGATPEGRFRRNQVDPFLKTLPNSFFISIQQKTIAGSPDKIGVCRGRFVAIEVKRWGGRLSVLQKYTLDKFRGAGGVALVASPENWEEVKEQLIQLDKGVFHDEGDVQAGDGV